MAKKDTFIEALIKKGYVRDSDGNYVPPQLAKAHTGQTLVVPRVKREFEPLHISDNVVLNSCKPLMVFEVEAMGAPRMTRSDQWKTDPFHPDPKKRQRKPVAGYFKMKAAIRLAMIESGFKQPENHFHIIFYLPMPHSWSKKKKDMMRGADHDQKPDADNLLKGYMDTVFEEDKKVSDVRVTKYWGDSGKIIIYEM